MNNKVCPKCQNINENTALFCSKCGEKLDTKLEKATEKIKEGNTLATISLILYFAASLCFVLLASLIKIETISKTINSIGALCPISGIITMIYGRIKYPNNKFLKTVMWIIIISVLIGILLFILLMIWCYVTCSNMDTSGCG